MSDNPTINYFGSTVVERAIADYFAKHGVTEHVRDHLMDMEKNHIDDFFQMVCDFVEKNS